MSVSAAEEEKAARLAARLIADEPALPATDVFGPLVVAGMADVPTLFFEDHSEIALFSKHGDLALEYRSLLLAGEGDLVVVGEPRKHAFESYCREVLKLGGPDVLRPAPLGSAPWQPPLAIRCLEDPKAMERIVALARHHGRLNVVPYIGMGNAWRLAAKIAEKSGAEVRVAAPPPRLTRRVNDKLWFARRVAELLGRQALPPAYAAFGPAALAGRVAAIARRYPRVVVKVPDSAGSEGNLVFDSCELRDLPLSALRLKLLRLLYGRGWRDTYPLMVEVWDCPVIASPSVQMWVPLPADGPPVVAGIFDQVVLGEAREFVGATPCALPRDCERRLCAEALRLATLFQMLGYFGCCSFDAVLVGDDLASATLHWIECNGRWGGVSIPMALARRLGDGRRREIVVVQRSDMDGPPTDFATILNRIGDRLYRPGLSERGVVILSPGGIESGRGLHFMALADTAGAAADTAARVAATLADTDAA